MIIFYLHEITPSRTQSKIMNLASEHFTKLNCCHRYYDTSAFHNKQTQFGRRRLQKCKHKPVRNKPRCANKEQLFVSRTLPHLAYIYSRVHERAWNIFGVKIIIIISAAAGVVASKHYFHTARSACCCHLTPFVCARRAYHMQMHAFYWNESAPLYICRGCARAPGGGEFYFQQGWVSWCKNNLFDYVRTRDSITALSLALFSVI
jgi:hypothetical protein